LVSPLLFADWGEINRVFCTVMWIVALILVVLIVGNRTSFGPACAGKATHGGTQCVAVAAHAREH
jgi:uncharacterized membrane protein